jgi:hypothetical protein
MFEIAGENNRFKLFPIQYLPGAAMREPSNILTVLRIGYNLMKPTWKFMLWISATFGVSNSIIFFVTDIDNQVFRIN